jgi:hypothetical protein
LNELVKDIMETLTLSQVEKALEGTDTLSFTLPSGKRVPRHFHVTEVGLNTRHFIDCGGTVRKEERINFQLWTSVDYHHRLGVQKLKGIIGKSKRALELGDLPVEVEFQGETIGRYGLGVHEGNFHLLPLQTDCLAKENCGIPAAVVEAVENCCSPGSGCC